MAVFMRVEMLVRMLMAVFVGMRVRFAGFVVVFEIAHGRILA